MAVGVVKSMIQIIDMNLEQTKEILKDIDKHFKINYNEPFEKNSNNPLNFN